MAIVIFEFYIYPKPEIREKIGVFSKEHSAKIVIDEHHLLCFVKDFGDNSELGNFVGKMFAELGIDHLEIAKSKMNV